MTKLKILNLYAGIGGNRKLWDTLGIPIEVTAIENNEKIVKIYQDFFPNDKVIIEDAHNYLLEHFKEFDFIWSSPPCPTHSRLRKGLSMNAGAKAVYPNMELYEEILFLQGYFEGKWVVENVDSWYKPLIKPKKLGRHYFWSNFPLTDKKIESGRFSIVGGINKEHRREQNDRLSKEFGFDLTKFKIKDITFERTLLRNCVNPELGLHILKMAFKEPQLTLNSLTLEKEQNHSRDYIKGFKEPRPDGSSNQEEKSK